MAKSKKEIENIILEQTNFIPRNEKGKEIFILLKAKKNAQKTGNTMKNFLKVQNLIS